MWGFIVFLSPTVEGKRHDKDMAGEYVKHVGNIRLKADLAFVGFRPDGAEVETPIKKKKGAELTKLQKRLNRIKASERVYVEHAIGGAKILRICKDKIRNYKFGFKDDVMQTACSLYNYSLSHRIKKNTFYS